MILCLKKCLDQERVDDIEFLRFLSTPTIENAIILSVFNPKMEEVVKYLEILNLHKQELNKKLHKNIYEIRSVATPRVVLERLFFLFNYIREKESTNEYDPRRKFQFIAIEEENTLNLFHIKLVGIDEYMYMTEIGYCKYGKLSPEDNFQWHVIGVHDVDKEGKIKDEENPESFMLCTKRWPSRIVCMNGSYFKFATGMVNPNKVSKENMFKVRS